jgi:hypothetical protein
VRGRKGARLRTPSRPEGSHPQDRTACPANALRSGPGFAWTPDGLRMSIRGIASDQPGASGLRRAGGHHPDRVTSRRCQVLLRKEVIQPHLPVRLPCYDFTPIAGPTFGSSLPEGLGH